MQKHLQSVLFSLFPFTSNLSSFGCLKILPYLSTFFQKQDIAPRTHNSILFYFMHPIKVLCALTSSLGKAFLINVRLNQTQYIHLRIPWQVTMWPIWPYQQVPTWARNKREWTQCKQPDLQNCLACGASLTNWWYPYLRTTIPSSWHRTVVGRSFVTYQLLGKCWECQKIHRHSQTF